MPLSIVWTRPEVSAGASAGPSAYVGCARGPSRDSCSVVLPYREKGKSCTGGSQGACYTSADVHTTLARDAPILDLVVERGVRYRRTFRLTDLRGPTTLFTLVITALSFRCAVRDFLRSSCDFRSSSSSSSRVRSMCLDVGAESEACIVRARALSEPTPVPEPRPGAATGCRRLALVRGHCHEMDLHARAHRRGGV